jgi:hypothetical protein
VVSRSFAITTNQKKTNAPLAGHRNWLKAQHQRDESLFEPTVDLSYGIYVLLAPSLSEAKTLVTEDYVRGIGTMECWNVTHTARSGLNGPTVAAVERMAVQDKKS